MKTTFFTAKYVMRSLSLVVFIFSSYVTFSQDIELFGGVNRNAFFNFPQEGHFSAEYKPAYGYTAGVALDNILFLELRHRITFQYERYNGKVSASNGGLGSGYSVTADIDKSVVSAGFFPLNVTILKKIDLNAGILLSVLVDESFEGIYKGWSVGGFSSQEDLNDRYREFNAKANLGFQARVAYNLKFSDLFHLTPQYMYHFGVTKEFMGFPEETKSMRHYLGVGLKMEL